MSHLIQQGNHTAKRSKGQKAEEYRQMAKKHWTHTQHENFNSKITE